MSDSQYGYVGTQSNTSDTCEFNAHEFLARMVRDKTATATVVQVMKVTSAGGIAPAGTVDVLPLVNQIDGYGNATPHGILHNLPYLRLQGGAAAVIIDPVVGDLGIAVFASHDISSVKVNRKQANPGSRRRYDMADGMYLGGLLNSVPTSYVAFTSSGINITSPMAVTISAPMVSVMGSLAVSGSVTAGAGGSDSVTLQHHIHGSGSPPNAGT